MQSRRAELWGQNAECLISGGDSLERGTQEISRDMEMSYDCTGGSWLHAYIYIYMHIYILTHQTVYLKGCALMLCKFCLN
jgi:hypothetical protein